MTCNSCGSAIETFNRFCPKCGAPAQFQAPPPAGPAPYQSPYNPPQQQMYSGPGTPPPRKSSCGKIILILGIILVLLLGAVAAAIYFGYGALEKKLKSSEPYTLAITALKENPEVKEKMGDIQETGFPLGAFTEDANGSGNAAFTMSVKGARASGQYNVELERSDSKWRLKHGLVRLANGETIYIADKSKVDIDSATNTSEPPSPPIPDESSSSVRTVSGGVLNAKATSLPKPAYPPLAKKVGAYGTVVVQVLVDEKGNVVSAKAISGHPILQGSAVAAARGAKFTPTLLNGKPVKVRGVINYNFVADEN